MSKDFPLFSKQIRANFDGFIRNIKEGHEIFVVDVNPDMLWEYYLEAFPDGENPVFRTRTEHDCSCCRNFIKNVAGLIQVIDGEVMTVWDNCTSLPYPYNAVGDAMNEFVRTFFIRNIYRTAQTSYGAEMTRELLEGTTRTWHHFSASMPFGIIRDDVPEFQGTMTANAQVFRRGLDEITSEATETIIELIKENSIYRGEEHLAAVTGFFTLQKKYRKLNSNLARDLFVWSNLNERYSRFRNTVIGTLAVDISAGMALDDAVRIFESKVAPENYKRPKSLITAKMVKEAEATLESLGMSDSIHRRFAKLHDISINNVIWADRTAQTKMKGSLISELLAPETKKNQKKIDPAQFTDIKPEDFFDVIVPLASSMELFVDNSFQSNFISLTAPAHADTKTLFKWDNDFAWSYDGNVADSSIQKRVKAAGGRVEGALMRVSLGWFNTDDLDIHVKEPDGNVIYFGNKSDKLDVDMNAFSNLTDKPVENVSWMKTPLNGVYTVSIYNYNRRNSHNVGFELEVESNGSISTFKHMTSVPDKKAIAALKITVLRGEIVTIDTGTGVEMTQAPSGVSKWGVTTGELVPVETILYSPNFWDGGSVGNLHTFFILRGCQNPEPTRGIYNEFLHGALEKHRKVFEVLGSKTQCPLPANPADQLSGLGFSSTKRAEVKVVVNLPTGNRFFNVMF